LPRAAPRAILTAMRTRIVGILALVVIVCGLAVFAWQRRESPQAQRDDLVAQFVAVVSDSVSKSDALQEIHGLFYLFYGRADAGKIAQEDVDYITNKLAGYVRARRIGRKELDYFMAEVGYRTYKNDPRYNPDSTIDNPILNPKHGAVKLGRGATFDSSQYDSTFWKDFEEWKEEHAHEFSDTARRPDRR
jgi:hypothetical protein